MTKDRRFHVGQNLWLVSSQRKGHACEVTVAKVGRKWVELGLYYGRFNAETMEIDGGQYSSPGTVYESRDAYMGLIARRAAWEELRNKIRYLPMPLHLSLADVQQIYAVLRIEVPE